MTQHTYTVRGKSVVTCDFCGARDETPEFDGHGWGEVERQAERLAASGWRFHASSSSRHYCPLHSTTEGDPR